MKFAFSARYGRRDELRGYAAALRQLGHTVTSSWLSEVPAWEDDGVRIADTAAVNRRVALQDTDDIDACDTLIGFTEEAGTPNRGGRDREIGYAMGRGKKIILVGPRPCMFDFHPAVGYWYPDWKSCLRAIQAGTIIAEATADAAL